MGRYFPGSSTDRINVGSGSSLDNPTIGTVWCWFKFTSNGGHYLLAQADSAFSKWKHFYVSSGRAMVMSVSRATTAFFFNTPNSLVSNGVDYFAAWSFDLNSGSSADQHLYLGTVATPATEQSKSAQGIGSGSVWDGSGEDWHIGSAGNSGGFSSGGGGVIVAATGAVFGRQLTLKEIVEQQWKTSVVPDQSGMWNLGCPGSTIIDISPNGNHGIPTGAPLAVSPPVLFGSRPRGVNRIAFDPSAGVPVKRDGMFFGAM